MTSPSIPRQQQPVVNLAELEIKVKSLLRQGAINERTGEVELARAQFHEAEEFVRTSIGERTMLYAECLHNLALFNWKYGCGAVDHALKALKIIDEIDGSHGLQTWQDIVTLLHHMHE
jgi:hypothetical protein